MTIEERVKEAIGEARVKEVDKELAELAKRRDFENMGRQRGEWDEPRTSNQKLCDALALAHSYLYDAIQYGDVLKGNRIQLAMQEIGGVMDKLRGAVETSAAPTNPEWRLCVMERKNCGGPNWLPVGTWRCDDCERIVLRESENGSEQRS